MTDQEKAATNPAYRAADLDLATAHGLCAGLDRTMRRMAARTDCPVWFIKSMGDYIRRSNELIGVLARHRDDIPKHIPPQPPITTPTRAELIQALKAVMSWDCANDMENGSFQIPVNIIWMIQDALRGEGNNG